MIEEIESGEKTVPQALKEVKVKEKEEAAANRDDEQTRRAFRRLYSSKHQNRAGAINSVDFTKLENNFSSILKSHKSHMKDLVELLTKIQMNGHGQSVHESFNNTINEATEIISYLRKIVSLYEAANESVQFYADNRDTLNKVYEKEAEKIVKDFKPVWKIEYYNEQNEVIKSHEFCNSDIKKVESKMNTKKPDTYTKAVATVEHGLPEINPFHKPYVEIKEFKHEPIEVLPKKK
jgi:hypothetical protein